MHHVPLCQHYIFPSLLLQNKEFAAMQPFTICTGFQYSTRFSQQKGRRPGIDKLKPSGNLAICGTPEIQSSNHCTDMHSLNTQKASLQLHCTPLPPFSCILVLSPSFVLCMSFLLWVIRIQTFPSFLVSVVCSNFLESLVSLLCLLLLQHLL